MGPAPEPKKSIGSMSMRYSSRDVVHASKDNAKTRPTHRGDRETLNMMKRLRGTWHDQLRRTAQDEQVQVQVQVELELELRSVGGGLGKRYAIKVPQVSSAAGRSVAPPDVESASLLLFLPSQYDSLPLRSLIRRPTTLRLLVFSLALGTRRPHRRDRPYGERESFGCSRSLAANMPGRCLRST